MRYKKIESFVERNIYGKYFLINIKENYMNDKCYLYELNEIGHFIWNQIDRSHNMDDLVNNIIKETVDDVSYEKVHDDTAAFIEKLIIEGFVEEE